MASKWLPPQRKHRSLSLSCECTIVIQYEFIRTTDKVRQVDPTLQMCRRPKVYGVAGVVTFLANQNLNGVGVEAALAQMVPVGMVV